MNTAKKIKTHFNGDFNLLVQLCEQSAVEIDQDWFQEKTTYFFEDKSFLIWSGQSVATGKVIA